jgi:hypothetical protein
MSLSATEARVTTKRRNDPEVKDKLTVDILSASFDAHIKKAINDGLFEVFIPIAQYVTDTRINVLDSSAPMLLKVCNDYASPPRNFKVNPHSQHGKEFIHISWAETP